MCKSKATTIIILLFLTILITLNYHYIYQLSMEINLQKNQHHEFVVATNIPIKITKTKTYSIVRNDGFGSQYLAFIGCIAYCALKENNCSYIHTPIKSIQHSIDDNNASSLSYLNEFIGIPFKEETNNDITSIIYKKECPLS